MLKCKCGNEMQKLPDKCSNCSMEFDSFSGGYARVNKKNLYGFVDESGKLVIKPRFKYASCFINGQALAKKDNKNITIIDTHQKKIAPWFKAAGDFSEGLAYVKRNNLYGFINKAGEIVIDLQFEDAHNFSEGLAAIKLNNKWGFIDTTGKITIEPAFESVISRFFGGFALIDIQKYPGSRAIPDTLFVDKNGVCHNNRTHYFSEGLATSVIDKKTGYINQNGEIVIEPKFYSAHRFKNGFAVITTKKWYSNKSSSGIIDKNGNIIVVPQFEQIRNFSDGLAAVKVGVNWGFIDTTGEFVIEPKFNTFSTSVDDFHYGLARTRINGKYGYIDKQGNLIIESQFDSARDFSEGMAAVSINNKWGFINQMGELIIDYKFKAHYESNSVNNFCEGLAMVKDFFGRCYYIDKTGEIGIKKYSDEIVTLSDKFIYIETDNLKNYFEII